MRLLVHPNSAGQHLTSFQPLLYHRKAGLPHSTQASSEPFIFHLEHEKPSQDTVSMVARLVSYAECCVWVFCLFVCLFEGLCALYCVQDNYPPMTAVLLLKIRYEGGKTSLGLRLHGETGGESCLCDAERKSPLAPTVHSLYVWTGTVPSTHQEAKFHLLQRRFKVLFVP